MKGGVGKTTIDAFLAQALSLLGFKVLVIDMDPNNNLTDYFLRDISIETISSKNIRQTLTGESTSKKLFIQQRSKLIAFLLLQSWRA
nr:ParA family protein [Leptospira mayottensis]